MTITDLSGEIRPGLWKYGDMYPDYQPRQIHAAPDTFFCEVFDGFNSQTGTYLETTAHFNGYEGQKLLEDYPLSRKVNLPCRILRLDIALSHTERPRITAEDFQKALKGVGLVPGEALLFSCGWEDWYSEDFLSCSPYLSRDAMVWILKQKPSLLGSDLPSWEKDEHVFELFSKTDTLMAAPLVNLRKPVSEHGLLTVLTPHLPGTCCAPARAIFVEE
ncbi:MAG: cyclase family protein [Oscillospiraceae bacterium]|nr:cyclase family protein [Oscillospiraceae bacterium]